MNLRNDKALTPFLRHIAQVCCKGVSHTYRDTVPVAILAGASPASGGASLQGQVADQYTVIVQQSDWHAEFPPALGTTFFTLENGTLTVQQANIVAETWHCLCTRHERGRAL